MVDRWRCIRSYLQLGPLLEILKTPASNTRSYFRKKGSISYEKKKGKFLHFQGAQLFPATLMLMHETPKLGSEHTLSRIWNCAESKSGLVITVISRRQCFDKTLWHYFNVWTKNVGLKFCPELEKFKIFYFNSLASYYVDASICFCNWVTYAGIIAYYVIYKLKTITKIGFYNMLRWISWRKTYNKT